MFRKLAVTIAAVGGLAGSSTAWAHHSFSQYDGSKKVELSGTVVSYQWSNPHVWILLLVKNQAGALQEYSIECPAIIGLSRVGWTAKSLHKGDKIRVIVHPTRSASLAGALYEVTLPDGSKLGQTQIQRNRYTEAVGAPQQAAQPK